MKYVFELKHLIIVLKFVVQINSENNDNLTIFFYQPSKGGLISGIFLTLALLSKKGVKCRPEHLFFRWRVLRVRLTSFFGDLSQSEKPSDIKQIWS